MKEKTMEKRIINALVVCLLLSLVFSCYVFIETSVRVRIFPLGQGRSILLYNSWDDIDSCFREFQVRDRFGRMVNNGCFVQFCDEPEQNEYKVFSSDDGNLISVVDYQYSPPSPIIICDFSTGNCSPCDTTEQEEHKMLEMLKNELPDLP